MQLYAPKQLKYGFIILCTERNVNLARYTFNSITLRYNKPQCVIVMDHSATDKDVKELNALCPVYRGDKTFSSLINEGFRHAPAEWNFVVIAGTTMRGRLDQKFSMFVNDDKDILFPVAGRKFNFVEATINGLFIHKKTFQEVGPLPCDDSLEESKAIWAGVAIEKQCRFKAIVGSKLC